MFYIQTTVSLPPVSLFPFHGCASTLLPIHSSSSSIQKVACPTWACTKHRTSSWGGMSSFPCIKGKSYSHVSDSTVQATRWSNTWQGPRSVLCRLLKHQSIVHEFPRVQVSCLCGSAPTSVMTLTSTWVVFIRNDF